MWQKLKKENPKGIMILAPMADVTDNPFRRLINKIGKPDLFFTEFVAVDGLAHKDASEKLQRQILTSQKDQKPIVAQLFGGSKENFFEGAQIATKRGFTAIDINMGCPQKNILAQNSGAALTQEKNWELVKDIFEETKRGAVVKKTFWEFWKKGKIGENTLDVSIKTRIGYKKIDMEWVKFVLTLKPAAFIIHLRIQKEMSKVKAHWELMTEIRKYRDEISPKTVLIGNGDVSTLEEAQEKVKKYKIDGVMIGRGIFENPWLFTRDENGVGKKFEDFSIKEKLHLVLLHTRYFEEEFGEIDFYKNAKYKRGKNFNLLKKFFKIYVRGFAGAKELRMRLMEASSENDIKRDIKDFLDSE